MDALGDDLVRCVAHTSVEAAIKMGCICQRWRDAVEGGEGGAFGIRNALAAIGETAIQADLVAGLALSKIHVKMGQHTKKRIVTAAFTTSSPTRLQWHCSARTAGSGVLKRGWRGGERAGLVASEGDICVQGKCIPVHPTW